MSRPWPKKPAIARTLHHSEDEESGNFSLNEWWVFWDVPSQLIPWCSISSPAPPKSHPKPGDSWASHTAFPQYQRVLFPLLPPAQDRRPGSKSMWSMPSCLKSCKIISLRLWCIKRSSPKDCGAWLTTTVCPQSHCCSSCFALIMVAQVMNS